MDGAEMSNELRFFGYEIDAAMRDRLAANLEQILAGGPADRLAKLAAQDLVALVDIALRAYYEQPADMISLSPLIRKAADTGMSAVSKAVDMVIHRVLAKRSLEDLQQMARDMSSMLCSSQDEPPRHYVCFPLPAHLYERSQLLIARVHTDSDVDGYRADIIGSLEDLIEEAIQVYYVAPISKVEVGRITRVAADMGMTTVKKGSSMVLHKVFKTMPHATLMPLAEYFQTLLHQGLLPHVLPATARR